MKTVFIGAVEISYRCLEEILSLGVDVRAIFTVNDQKKLNISGCIPFDGLASKRAIPIYKVNSVNDKENIKRIEEIGPDIIFVIGWQQLISSSILGIPKRGSIGMHSSLLPKYRGHAPVNWAIINGEKKTGITMIYLNECADKGDIIGQKEVDIEFEDTCKTIYDKLTLKARELLRENIDGIRRGSIKPIKQKDIREPMPKRCLPPSRLSPIQSAEKT